MITSMWLVPLLATACTSPGGSVQIRTWAEDTVPQGFAAADTDGWEVTFDHWLTSFRSVTFTDPDDGSVKATTASARLVDFKTANTPVNLEQLDLPSGRHDLSFELGPPSTDSVDANPVDPALKGEMISGGWTHYVIGSATDGSAAKTFRLGLAIPTANERCVNGLDGTAGVAVSAGDVTNADLYLHADHLLWDELGTEEAGLSFQAWADADGNGDGEITLAELDAVRISDIGYETAGLDVTTLLDFIGVSVSIMGHLNGGGECVARVL